MTESVNVDTDMFTSTTTASATQLNTAHLCEHCQHGSPVNSAGN